PCTLFASVSLFFSGAAPLASCTLSLHDALPILRFGGWLDGAVLAQPQREGVAGADDLQFRAAVLLRTQLVVEEREEAAAGALVRSEEHTSELQSRENLVCRLLLEKKKKRKHSKL